MNRCASRGTSVKDPGAPVPTELGRGAIDTFAAASQGKIRALFAVQDPTITEMPSLEAIKIDFEYVNNLKV